MPRLNNKGEAVMGVAGGPCSVEGRIVASVGGSACWLDDDHVIYNTGSDTAGWRVEFRNVRTSAFATVLPHGANLIAANAGQWLTWAPGIGLEGAVTAPAGSTSLANTDGRGEIGRDGTIAYIPNYQAGVPTILRSLNGSETAIQEAAYGLCIYGPNLAIWNGGKTTAPNPPVLLHGSRGIRYFNRLDRPWLIYWTEQDGGMLVAHAWDDSSQGIIVAKGNDMFYHDAVMVNGTLVVAWSISQGEAPTHLRKVEYDPTKFAASIVPLNTVPVPSPSSTISIKAFERKMWMAPFYSHSERYGDTPLTEHNGNAIICVENETDPNTLQRELQKYSQLGVPLIVDGGKRLYPEFDNITIAYWAGNAVSAQHALGLGIEKPVIWYEDTNSALGWPAQKPSWLSGNVWPTVQVYRQPNEAISVFRNRVTDLCNKVSSYGQPLFIVPRFDDFNGSGTIDQTLEAMPIYVELINTYQIIGFLPFSDRRGNSISKNTSLWNWARAFYYAMPARPNRFDYWQPRNMSMDAVLKNKFGQSTSLITLSQKEKDYILSSL